MQMGFLSETYFVSASSQVCNEGMPVKTSGHKPFGPHRPLVVHGQLVGDHRRISLGARLNIPFAGVKASSGYMRDPCLSPVQL